MSVGRDEPFVTVTNWSAGDPARVVDALAAAGPVAVVRRRPGPVRVSVTSPAAVIRTADGQVDGGARDTGSGNGHGIRRP